MIEKHIDLHMHSTMSDGTFTPQELVQEALRRNLSAIALTDHDSTEGVRAAQKAAAGTGLEVVPGVELSAYEKQEMHILGYYIHPEHAALKQYLARMAQSRVDRVQAMVRKLSENGFSISWEEVRWRAKHMVSRVHIAQSLVQKEYAVSVGDAFERLIGEGKPYFVPRRQIGPQEAIQAIHDAGGLAVLAHPYFLGRDASLEELLRQLPELDGMECHYPRHTTEQWDYYRKKAQQFGLLETGGSDFHGANRPDAEMGKGCGGRSIPYEYLKNMKIRVQKDDEAQNRCI